MESSDIMKLDLASVLSLFFDNDNILIISHENPDGDTVGSAFALHYALNIMGKTSRVICSDEIPKRYKYITSNYFSEEFEPEFIVSVDTADSKLIGKNLEFYKDKINLCIDHHVSNTNYAEKSYVDSTASSTCEIIYKIIKGFNIEITLLICKCIYTGIVSDTGCFKYTNTTYKTHQIASELLKMGLDYGKINYDLFSGKSKEYLKIEHECISSIKYFHKDKCAIMVIPMDLVSYFEIPSYELQGLSAIPVQIRGVLVGITIKSKAEKDEYKISIRTNGDIDASKICAEFGGGGHKAAAGCLVFAPIDDVILKLVNSVANHLI